MSILKKLCRKVCGEKASETIALIIILPLLWGLIMTIIDFGIFMQDRTMLVSDMREGARTVAIFGGSNKVSNDLIRAYGTTCGMTPSTTGGGYRGDATNNSAYGNDLVACLLKNQIMMNKGYSQIVISNIKCGVSNPGNPTNPTLDSKVKIGQAVSCSAHYRYMGLPGSALGLFGGNFMLGGADSSADNGSLLKVNAEIRNTGWNEGNIVVSAQSEVTL